MNQEIKLKGKTKESEENSFFGVAEKILSQLPERAQAIVKKRFGLTEDYSRQTLEKIGSDYGVTRERVRQIISDAKKSISKKCAEIDFQQIENKLFLAVEKKYGIIKEAEILSELNLSGLRKEENAMRFLVNFSPRIRIVFLKNEIEKSWVSSADALEKTREVSKVAKDILARDAKLFSDADLVKKIIAYLPKFSKKEVLSYLSVLSAIGKNKFGKWGMRHWPEVSPKGSREKIYLVLKETNEPLHFTQIANLIEKHKLGTKKVHPQTIHNELIKDSRFVLIGRGIYALSEWGYSGGVVKDVLRDILEKSEEVLDREAIIEKVFAVRKVKRTTIMINLNSRNFEKVGNGYRLKK